MVIPIKPYPPSFHEARSSLIERPTGDSLVITTNRLIISSPLRAAEHSIPQAETVNVLLRLRFIQLSSQLQDLTDMNGVIGACILIVEFFPEGWSLAQCSSRSLLRIYSLD